MGWLSRIKKRTSHDEQHVRQRHQLDGNQAAYTFRRSRTLTGTTSNKVNASAESRTHQLKTPRLKVHELHEERSKIVKLLAVLVLGMCVLVFLIVNYISGFTILYSQQTHARPDTTGYQRSLQDYFASQPFQRFTFLLDPRQLEIFMRAKHSELSGFMTTHNWYGGNVAFTVSFRKPLIVWQTGSSHFYVDTNGIAFTYDDFNDPLVSVEDQSGIAPNSGSSVASQRFIMFLGQMVGAVNQGGKGQVSSVIIPASTREIDLKLQGRAYPIKTEIDRDPLQQAQDIINALKYFDAHGITPQYVDVRVAGEAFYK
jgi:hypothetical protein